MKRVAIAGAGISGLALAWALRARGLFAQVFEAEPVVGGKIRSERSGGYLCEWGPQSFSFQDPAARALVRALGLEPRLELASDSALRRAVLVEGRLEVVPSTPLALARSSLLPWWAKARALADLALPRGPAARGDDESVASFARRRLGTIAAERVFFPLASGLYAGDPELISLPSAFPAFARLERERRSLLSAALCASGGSPRAARIATFRDGMGELPGALARALGEGLHLGATLRAVRERGGRWVASIEEDGRAAEVEADALAVAIPAHAAAPVLGGLDRGLEGTTSAIPYVPVVLCYLGYRRQALPPPDRYGFLVPPRERSRLLGGVFTSSIFPDHAPPGTTLVAARLGGARHPELAALEDGELAALAHAELSPLLGASDGPIFTKVLRHARALPLYTLGHRERLRSLEAAERRHPGLFLAGNAYRGLGIADCIREAEPLAGRIATFLKADSGAPLP
jgi:oxygen-dependent protoporphyrinogen oxidase